MADFDGHWAWIAAGAAIGGVISGGMKIYSNLGHHRKWYKGVGLAITEGAVSGALAATGLGLGYQIGGNAIINTASYFATEKKKSTFRGTVSSAGAGAISGWIGGRGANISGMSSAFK